MSGLRKQFYRSTICIVLASALGLAGCSSIDYPESTVESANSQLASGLRIAAGNTLAITVFDEPNLSGKFTVDANGQLALPLIGTIMAGGATTTSLTQTISSKLVEGGYVLVPRVAIEVANYQPIYVMGEVNNPGEYPYTPDLNHLQAIAKAGGYTPRANETTLVLERAGWEQPHKLKLSATPLALAPGDTIIIEQAIF